MKLTNKSMKRLSLYLFLLLFTFQTPSQADDIRDFQIEGMSIGDSLLDYFSKTEIENFYNYDDLPSSMKFRIAEFNSKEFDLKLKLYEGMQVFYKPEDKNFIIHGFNGYTSCSSKTECEKKLNNIVKDLSTLFKNSKILGGDVHIHQDDKSGKSTYKYYYLELENGRVSTQYQDWSQEVDYVDNVSVEIYTREAVEWIQNGYLKRKYIGRFRGFRHPHHLPPTFAWWQKSMKGRGEMRKVLEHSKHLFSRIEEMKRIANFKAFADKFFSDFFLLYLFLSYFFISNFFNSVLFSKINPIVSPTLISSPIFLIIFKIPLLGDSTSTIALLDSISNNNSFFFTSSRSFFKMLTIITVSSFTFICSILIGIMLLKKSFLVHYTYFCYLDNDLFQAILMME